MKLQTSIPPRRDGTVKVQGQDRQTYVFAAGPDGELACDVEDEATIAHLLATDQFYPANPEDADRALELVQSASRDGDEDEGGAGDLDDDDELEDAGNGGLPLEANTPPQVSPDRAAKHNAALKSGRGGRRAG